MAAKKKAKKKSTRKHTEHSAPRKSNKTDLKLDLRKGSQLDGGPVHVWHVHLKGEHGSVTAGSVSARNETEAKNKAKRLLRTLIA